MVKMITLNSREEWLKARQCKIGGSDASSVIGQNPYTSNVDLFEEKLGLTQVEDISDKPYVKYGTEAEHHLRELFKLDFPQYEVSYVDNNMWLNDEFPFAHASLDGWITDQEGRKGILEIKTTEIMRSKQYEQWDDKVPTNYYVQLLHYFMVTGFDFAILKAQLKYTFNDNVRLSTKHYFIERADHEDDIEYLKQAEIEFAQQLEKGIKPALILPQI